MRILYRVGFWHLPNTSWDEAFAAQNCSAADPPTVRDVSVPCVLPQDRIAKVVEHHAVHAAASGAALEAHARDVAELRMAILQAVEEHERSSMETRDALGKLAAAAGSCDMDPVARGNVAIAQPSAGASSFR